MTTDIYCTKCGKEFEPFADAIVIASAVVAPVVGDDYAAQESDSPYIETLCKECHEKASSPNRVVIVMEDGIESTREEIREIRAEWPNDVCVIVKDWLGERVMPIKPLGTIAPDEDLAEAYQSELLLHPEDVKDEPDRDELALRDEEDSKARDEELDLYYIGMGG